jgi:hypothetical protein
MKNIKTKTTLVIIAIIAIVFTSCENYRLTGIRGSGLVVSENIEISLIEGLNLEIPATVYLTKGDEQSIRIDAQQNILDNIETHVSNEVLTIKFDKNVAKHEDIYVYITLAHLKQLGISGSGEISSESNFTTENKLIVSISGSGNIDIAADAPEVEMSISGSGDIKLETFTQKLTGSISGSADILLDGKSEGSANYSISGSGNIKAYDFETLDCYVSTAGSGNAKVFATRTLDVKIAGSGDVYYKGNPTLSVNIAGSGNVVNAN